MKATPTTFELTRLELVALLEHASKDKTRPHIACLALDFANGRISATDGHRLAIIRDGDAPIVESKSVIFSREAAEMTAKICTNKKGTITIGADRSITIEGGAAPVSFSFVVSEQTSMLDTPPIDRVVDLTARKVGLQHSLGFVCMSARLLAGLTKVADAISLKSSRYTSDDAFDIDFTGPLEPIVARFSRDSNQWTIVIMPTRGGSKRAAAAFEF